MLKPLALATVLAFSMPSAAFAASQHSSAGLDLAVVVPVGNWGDVASVGIGGLLKINIAVGEMLALTGRAGYVFHLEKNGLNTHEAPVLLGLKLYFVDGQVRPYAAAELGVNFLTYSAGTLTSETIVRPGFTAGAGVLISGFDVHVQLYNPSFGDIDKYLGVMINAGFNFFSI